MKTATCLFLILVLACSAARAATDAAADSGLVLHVEVGSRLYPTWHEVQRLRMGELFYLGDSQLTARIDRFLPDFRLVDGKFLSLTHELRNPAARVVVFNDTTATDTCWAFLNFPPHYSPQSFFTFQLKDVQGFVPSAADSVPAAVPAAKPPQADSLQAETPQEAPHE